jgi:hypothetical protein
MVPENGSIIEQSNMKDTMTCNGIIDSLEMANTRTKMVFFHKFVPH